MFDYVLTFVVYYYGTKAALELVIDVLLLIIRVRGR